MTFQLEENCGPRAKGTNTYNKPVQYFKYAFNWHVGHDDISVSYYRLHSSVTPHRDKKLFPSFSTNVV